MIRWGLRRAIDKFERDWNYDAGYMRDMIDASPRAAWLFSRVTALGQFRRDIPLDAWCAAGITAVRHEDCGPCTQLGVTMAERAGVKPEVLRALLADDPGAMPPDVALVWRFTRATLAHDAAADDYDSRTELAEDLSIALLLTLDRLSPLERAAFLLHDVFDFSFTEVAASLERSEPACRQLAARARARVREVRPRGTTPPPERSGEIDAKHTQLMSAFVTATGSGDLDALKQLLAGDVRVVTDGGGKVAAALNVLEGADRAARFLVGATRKGWRDDYTVRFAVINDLPGLIIDAPDGPVQTAAFEIEGGVIRALYVVRNPDKLRHLVSAPTP
jgi:hypothetical protein